MAEASPSTNAGKHGAPNVARAGWIMMGSLFLSRILGIVREGVINARFGQSSGVLDSYSNAFAVPDILFYLIAGGALSSAFIPVFTQLLKTDREDEAWHLYSSLVTVMSVLILAFIVVAWVVAEPMLRAYGVKEAALPETVFMSRILLPAQYAFFIGGLMMGTLYARQVFSIPGLGPNIYNFGIIFGAAVLASFVMPPVSGMCWGALFGAFAGNILVPWYAMRRMGSRFRLVFDVKDENVRKVFRLMLPVVLGLSLPGVFFLILRKFANNYGMDGVVAAYQSGNAIMQAPLGIFGQSLAIAAFPALSEFFAQNRMTAYRDQLARTIRLIFYLSVPVAVVMLAVPDQVIGILLEHGKFTHADLMRTVPVLRLFAIGVPAWCLHPMLMRGFFSIQQSVKPIVIGTATTGLFIALCLAFQYFKLPFASLALAASVSAILMACVMTLALHRHAGPIDLKYVLTGFGQTAVASAALGGFFLACYRLLPGRLIEGHKLVQFGVFVLVFLLAGWLYYFMSKWMKMPETAYFSRAFRRRSGEPAQG